MCQSVWDVRGRRLISNMGEFADWLGIPLKELPIDPEDYDDSVLDSPSSCLCPIDIDYALDRAKVWHRRDVEGDDMRTLALKPENPSRA